MRQQDSEETLHYVDPPYVASTRDKGGDYAFEMDDQQHADLADFLKNAKGTVVLSGYESPLYTRLYGEWQQVRRAAHADGALARVECLWLSPNCPAPGLFA